MYTFVCKGFNVLEATNSLYVIFTYIISVAVMQYNIRILSTLILIIVVIVKRTKIIEAKNMLINYFLVTVKTNVKNTGKSKANISRPVLSVSIVNGMAE